MSLHENEKLIDKPQSHEFKIECIGYAITCGYGIEAKDENECYNDSTSNFAMSYAGLTAKKLNAEAMIVARSGIGIYKNYADSPDGSINCMPNVYDQTLISDSTTAWDFSKFTPDVLCLNLGTNDTSLGEYKTDLMYNAYLKFIKKIRRNYPKTKIVLLTGSMMEGNALSDVKLILDTITSQLINQGDRNIYRFDMTHHDGSLGYGADWHPSAKQHEKMSEELVDR